MAMRHIRIYFPRWYFPYNVGDTVMLSSLFRAVKKVYGPCFLEVISDSVTVEVFQNDPNVDRLRAASWLEMMLPKRFYRNKPLVPPPPENKNLRFVIWPEWHEETIRYISKGSNLKECIDSPYKNIISYNYALQISEEAARFPDLRPRIYLTEDEIAEGRRQVLPNSIAINMARIRRSQTRTDGEILRYRKSSWKAFVEEVKKYDPAVTVYEVGQEGPEGVGDRFIPNESIRKTASVLDAMDLVILSDGGVHNICNAIDKKVLLFQGYEWNPPDLFKMGNAIFNESYHLECRKKCHLFSDILGIESAKKDCGRECYGLDPKKLAEDCIDYLEGLRRSNG